jgi:hypothetical protein
MYGFVSYIYPIGVSGDVLRVDDSIVEQIVLRADCPYFAIIRAIPDEADQFTGLGERTLAHGRTRRCLE